MVLGRSLAPPTLAAQLCLPLEQGVGSLAQALHGQGCEHLAAGGTKDDDGAPGA